MFWYSVLVFRHELSFRSFMKSAAVSRSLVRFLKCSMTSLRGSSFMTCVASTNCFDTVCCIWWLAPLLPLRTLSIPLRPTSWYNRVFVDLDDRLRNLSIFLFGFFREWCSTASRKIAFSRRASRQWLYLNMERRISDCQMVAELEALERQNVLNERENRLVHKRKLEIYVRIYK